MPCQVTEGEILWWESVKRQEMADALSSLDDILREHPELEEKLKGEAKHWLSSHRMREESKNSKQAQLYEEALKKLTVEETKAVFATVKERLS